VQLFLCEAVMSLGRMTLMWGKFACLFWFIFSYFKGAHHWSFHTWRGSCYWM